MLIVYFMVYKCNHCVNSHECHHIHTPTFLTSSHPPIVLCLVGKLAIRAQKVAHYILNKFAGGKAVQPGDRVSKRERIEWISNLQLFPSDCTVVP